MRKSYVVFLVAFLLVHLAVLTLQIDRWPLTCYPMYANRLKYQNDIFHVGVVTPDGNVAFRAHPLNWSMNGPRFDRGLTEFEGNFVKNLLAFACPRDASCRIFRTQVSRDERGTYAFKSVAFE